ncbi:MAG: tannase/feruloyl esterase family alpha/beta hydrolase [Pseudomonadota bacterium]
MTLATKTGPAILLVLFAVPGIAAGAEASCEKLNLLRLAAVTALQARAVAAGPPPVEAVQPGPAAPAAAGGTQPALPAFCRVSATLAPSSESAIKVELWLPVAGWNGKLLGVGNGGWTGSIAYAALITGLQRGYATASTDTGHTGGSASFALGHPEKVIDFGYRAVHEMTVFSKQLVAAYYGSPQRHAYWNGCSAGGRQGMKEAQRYPEDYDGIIAGAPAADWTGRAAAALRVAKALRREEGSLIAPEQYASLHRAVLAACDAGDGVADGVLEDPRACKFDPGQLACGAEKTASCLNPAQVVAARTIYSPARNPASQREITSLYPGSEPGWTTWGGPRAFAIAVDHFRYVVTGDVSWDLGSFDFDRDVVLAERVDANTINALDPDIGAFLRRGGKLLHYHGWSDPQISPGNSVQYYERVAAAQAAAGKDSVEKLRANYRLFMLPGMAHCSGGEGPDTFDALSALEQWVEKGVAPERIVASRSRLGKVDRTRPLCPYPQVARYSGSGSTDDARSFACAAPSP